MTTAAGEVRPGRLARLVPALDWLGHYQRAWLRGDVVVALTTWALVVPQAIAYAQIAQLPPQAGLFAAFAALLGGDHGAVTPPTRVVVVDLTSSFRLSLPTLDTLAELHDELDQRGVGLWLARVRGSAMAELQASGLADRLGPARVHATVEDAVQAYANWPSGRPGR